MYKILNLAFVALATLLFLVQAAAAPFVASKGAHNKNTINFAGNTAQIELKAALLPYQAPSGAEADGSSWFMMTAMNDTIRPATRILIAGQPPDAGLHFFPLPARPSIRQVASSDAGVTVERAPAYGRSSYRVTIPPATSVALAIRVANSNSPPAVVAWTEPALVAHNRKLSIFVAAVAGLIAAAFVIAAGLAVMTGHATPRWSAVTLGMLFLTRLISAGMFDADWVTAVGGPYGISALAFGLLLAAGIKLADTVVPMESLWPGSLKYRHWSIICLTTLAVLAFIGVPGATLLTNIAVVALTACIALYLVHRGRNGVQAARVMAPSAAVFALVALVSALAAMGVFSDNPMAPVIAGGFAAAGAVLLTLAVAAGEGVAIVPAVRQKAKPIGLAERSANIAQLGEITQQDISSSHASVATQAIGASHQGVFDLDFHKDVVRLSREAAGLIGCKDGDMMLTHKAWVARVHDDDREIYNKALDDYRGHTGLAFRIEFRVKSESGRYPWFELRATMIGTGQKATRCLGLIADVTARKESEATSTERPLSDALTGLGNRIALIEDLEQLAGELANSIFVILDLDRFKSIHSSLGDNGGDQVLMSLGDRLRTRFADVARIYRVGGDSFALLFVDADGEPATIGNSLVKLCETPVQIGERNVFVPASIGIAPGTEIEDPLTILRNAELALMQAKRNGGGCARVYSREMLTSVPRDAVALEADLRHALECGQLDVFYQPIMRLKDESVAGFEALLRWNHPAKGLIEPSEFVAHSEETGLIVELGRFALERAVLDLAYWQKFFPLNVPLFMSVNFSRRQLWDPSFVKFLQDLLARHDVPPSTVRLEVTESAVQAGNNIAQALTNIRNLGIGLSIDDFGTGVSSLSQLKDLPFDTVKMDKSFLDEDTTLADGGAVMLERIISLAHGLNRTVIVEGVETGRDVALLKELSCEFAQGFYFSKPLPTADTLNFIAMHHRTHNASS